VLYDRRFRLKASASKITKSSVINITIWKTVFPDYVYQSSRFQPTIPANHYRLPRQPAFNHKQGICLKWNENAEGCSRSSCHYDHVCYWCVHNPRVADKRHKVIECSYREKRAPSQQRRGPPALINLWVLNTQHITYSLANGFVSIFFFFPFNLYLAIQCICTYYSSLTLPFLVYGRTNPTPPPTVTKH